MPSTARRCEYPLVSIREAREAARGAAGELSLANAVFRRRRSTTSPPPPGPAALVAGFGATRLDSGPGGLGTRIRHSSRPQQQAGPCGPCATVSYLGRQLGCSMARRSDSDLLQDGQSTVKVADACGHSSRLFTPAAMSGPAAPASGVNPSESSAKQSTASCWLCSFALYFSALLVPFWRTPLPHPLLCSLH
jgi:hypothetical protein